MRNGYVFFATVLLYLLTPQVFCQESHNQSSMQYSDRPAQYVLGNRDVLLITVNLWGHVRKPGIYNVPSSFGIIDLLSSAGGPLKSAKLKEVRIVRKNQKVLFVDVEKFIKTGSKDVLFPLQPGDVIVVSGNISDVFGRVVGVMRDLAIVVNVILLATRIR